MTIRLPRRPATIAIATLPARARPLDAAALAAILGGRGWWRRVWRRVRSLPATLRGAVAVLAAALRRWRRRAAWQRAISGRRSVFRSFWQAFRF